MVEEALIAKAVINRRTKPIGRSTEKTGLSSTKVDIMNLKSGSNNDSGPEESVEAEDEMFEPNGEMPLSEPAARCDDNAPTLSHYMKALRTIKPMAESEEFAIARRAADGDALAKRQLVEVNLALVLVVARPYAKFGLSIEDLLQEGSLGLIEAAERFDPSRGVRFATYARWWIRQAIGNALTTQSRTIRLPSHIVRAMSRVFRARRELLDKTSSAQGKSLNEDLKKIAAATGKSIAEVSELLTLSQGPLSLDAPVEEGENVTLGETIEGPEDFSVEKACLSKELISTVVGIVNLLPAAERTVVANRFGFHDGEPKTLEAIGALLSLSAERVRQLQEQALKRLKLMLDARSIDVSAFL